MEWSAFALQERPWKPFLFGFSTRVARKPCTIDWGVQIENRSCWSYKLSSRFLQGTTFNYSGTNVISVEPLQLFFIHFKYQYPWDVSLRIIWTMFTCRYRKTTVILNIEIRTWGSWFLWIAKEEPSNTMEKNWCALKGKHLRWTHWKNLRFQVLYTN